MISKKILAVMFYTFVLGLSVWELFSWGSSPLDKTLACILALLCIKGIAGLLIADKDKK